MEIDSRSPTWGLEKLLNSLRRRVDEAAVAAARLDDAHRTKQRLIQSGSLVLQQTCYDTTTTRTNETATIPTLEALRITDINIYRSQTSLLDVASIIINVEFNTDNADIVSGKYRLSLTALSSICGLSCRQTARLYVEPQPNSIGTYSCILSCRCRLPNDTTRQTTTLLLNIVDGDSEYYTSIDIGTVDLLKLPVSVKPPPASLTPQQRRYSQRINITALEQQQDHGQGLQQYVEDILDSNSTELQRASTRNIEWRVISNNQSLHHNVAITLIQPQGGGDGSSVELNIESSKSSIIEPLARNLIAILGQDGKVVVTAIHDDVSVSNNNTSQEQFETAKSNVSKEADAMIEWLEALLADSAAARQSESNGTATKQTKQAVFAAQDKAIDAMIATDMSMLSMLSYE